MRRLLSILLVALMTITLAACSGSGTGSDPDNDDDNNELITYTVSVDMTPPGAGSVSPSLDEAYEEGKTIQLLANPGDDYVFTGWTGDMEGAVNPLPLTVSRDFNITANFELKNYALAVTTEGEGSVQENILTQKTSEYGHGTVVELIATPAKGYAFVTWKGDITGADNPGQITVDAPKEVTAVFEKKDYALTVTTQGSGAISEQVVSKAKGYEYGDVVELTPGAAEGWEFVEWSGDLTGSARPAQITIDSAKAVTAVFRRQTFALDVSIQGEGTITKDPAQNEYQYGDNVTLSAEPDQGWRFREWAGEISGTTPEIRVTVHSERDITAVFEEKPLFHLAPNGYTVICPEAQPGQKGYLNGEPAAEPYTAVDRQMLDQMIGNNEDVSTGVCTSPISDMSELFRDQTTFNRDISNWDVSNVTDMYAMFADADSFNQDIGSWDVGNVTDISWMFFFAGNFNQDIGNWDVSSAMDMTAMFYEAGDFNQDIGNWDVSSVSGMTSMFEWALSFDQDISSWCVTNIDSQPSFFDSYAGFMDFYNLQPQWGTCPL